MKYQVKITLLRTPNPKFNNLEIIQSDEFGGLNDNSMINHRELKLTVYTNQDIQEFGLPLIKLKKQVEYAYGLLGSRDKSLVSLEKLAMLRIIESINIE